MSLQRFPVTNPGPEFLIIAFFGHDNDLYEHQERQLSGLAQGAGPNVAILAITDIAFGPARVLEITTGNRRVVEELGEIDTGDAECLGELLTRALISYPQARRIAIGFAGHSTGIFNEADTAPFPTFALFERAVLSASRRIEDDGKFRAEYSLMIDRTGGRLTNKEAAAMIRSAFEVTGRTTPIDLLFFDGCINGMIEVVAEFEDLAHCIVASEDDEPPMGWDYAKWLSQMRVDPPADGEAWGRQAVMAMKASYTGQTTYYPVTLSAIRAGAADLPVVDKFKALVATAAAFDRAGYDFLAWARRRTQILHRQRADSFDLRDFASHLADEREIEEMALAADALIVEFDRAVAESMVLGPLTATGLAFWFPGRLDSFQKDAATYRELSFDRRTGWSNFLDAHL